MQQKCDGHCSELLTFLEDILPRFVHRQIDKIQLSFCVSHKVDIFTWKKDLYNFRLLLKILSAKYFSHKVNIFVLQIATNHCLWTYFFQVQPRLSHCPYFLALLVAWNGCREYQKKSHPSSSKIQWENLWKRKMTLIQKISRLTLFTCSLFSYNSWPHIPILSSWWMTANQFWT